MKLKKTVEISGVIYKIKFPKKITAVKPSKKGHDELLGCINHDKREISIEKNRNDIPWIMFHELCHGTLECMDEEKLDNDETFVKAFSRILYGAVKSVGMFKD